MKIKPTNQVQISNIDPDLLYSERDVYYDTNLFARSPKPPTPEAIEKAQFKDKTYIWKGSAAYKAGKT